MGYFNPGRCWPFQLQTEPGRAPFLIFRLLRNLKLVFQIGPPALLKGQEPASRSLAEVNPLTDYWIPLFYKQIPTHLLSQPEGVPSGPPAEEHGKASPAVTSVLKLSFENYNSHKAAAAGDFTGRCTDPHWASHSVLRRAPALPVTPLLPVQVFSRTGWLMKCQAK